MLQFQLHALNVIFHLIYYDKVHEFFFEISKCLNHRHDTQHNDIQHNDVQHNDIQHNDVQHNDIQHNNIQHNDIQHNDIQHNDIQHNIKYNVTLNIMRLGIMANIVMLGVACKPDMLSVIMLSVVVPFKTAIYSHNILTFAGKAWSLPLEWSFTPVGSTLSANIKLGWKWMVVDNTLAY